MTVASSSTPTVSTIHHNTYPVMGMTCAACAVSLETYLGGQTGVEKVVVSYPNLSVFVGFDSEIITEIRLAEAAKEIGYEFPIIGVRPAMQFNSRYLSKGGSHWKLGSHQDWRTGQGSLDSAVCWFPLVDCGADLGSLQIIPGSHRNGLLDAQGNGYLGTIKEELPEDKFVQTSFEVGDLLLFSAFLVHRSGENSTQNIRWSIQLRYNNMEEKTFQERGFPMPYIYKPEEELVTPNFPKREMLDKIFA